VRRHVSRLEGQLAEIRAEMGSARAASAESSAPASSGAEAAPEPAEAPKPRKKKVVVEPAADAAGADGTADGDDA